MAGNLNLQSLEFGSCFSYTPRPTSPDNTNLDLMKKTKDYTILLKQDHMVHVKNEGDMPMTSYVVKIISKHFSTLPFADFFKDYTVLVPVPSSSLMTYDALWVPRRIADAMVSVGIGNEVAPILKRSKSIPKSSISISSERPSPLMHYESLTAEPTIIDIHNVVLIDDVITRGSTMIGCANKLSDENPGLKIRGFSMIRTIHDAISIVACTPHSM